MISSDIVSILKGAGPWVSIALLFAFGLVIPRWFHNERINDYQQRLKYTEAALDHEREINDFQNEQLSKLLILAETGNKVLEALQKSSNKEVL